MKEEQFSFDGEVYKAKIQLKEAKELHIPGRGGIMIDKDLPQGKTWSINYPTDLNAQFIIAKTKKNWIRIATKYIPLHFTKISIFRSREGFKMLWELRPWSGYKNYGSPELLIEEFNSDNEAIKEYKMWMEKVFKLKKKEANPDLPEWAHNTRLVLFLDMWGSDGIIINSYQDVINLIEDLIKLDTPKNTILFLAGWSWRWDARYPEYLPADALGGVDKFKEMVRVAHKAQFKIMPNMNSLGLDYALPEFRKMWRYQITDREGQKRGWPGCFPGAATYPFAYMRPCAKVWRRHLVDKIVKPALDYELESIYLDQTLVVFDDPGCNMERGLNKLLREIRLKLPRVLIGGEGCHERIIASIPFFQMHGAAWTLSQPTLYEKDSLVFTKLFRDYALFCGHISIPTAYPGGRQVGLLARGPFWDRYWDGKEGYRTIQKYYDKRGAIKTLRINYQDYGIDEETKRVIKELRRKRK